MVGTKANHFLYCNMILCIYLYFSCQIFMLKDYIQVNL